MKHLDTCFENAKVLVVEDYEFNMEIILEMLRMMGIEADTAINGEEAVEKLKQHTYDLVLMDILMPKLDGYETTRAIRQLSIQQPLISALTASVQESDKQSYFDAGMNGVLAKPLTLIELEEHLLKHLSNKLVKKRNPKK